MLFLCRAYKKDRKPFKIPLTQISTATISVHDWEKDETTSNLHNYRRRGQTRSKATTEYRHAVRSLPVTNLVASRGEKCSNFTPSDSEMRNLNLENTARLTVDLPYYKFTLNCQSVRFARGVCHVHKTAKPMKRGPNIHLVRKLSTVHSTIR